MFEWLKRSQNYKEEVKKEAKRRGRKPITDSTQKRTHQIKVSLNEEEYQILKSITTQYNTQMARILRETFFDYISKGNNYEI